MTRNPFFLKLTIQFQNLKKKYCKSLFLDAVQFKIAANHETNSSGFFWQFDPEVTRLYYVLGTVPACIHIIIKNAIKIIYFGYISQF